MQDDPLSRWPRVLKAWFLALAIVWLVCAVCLLLLLMATAPPAFSFLVAPIIGTSLLFLIFLVSIMPTFIFGSAAVALRESHSRLWRIAVPVAMVPCAALLSVYLSDDLLPGGIFSDRREIESTDNPKSFVIRFALALFTQSAIFLTARRLLRRWDRAGL